MLMTCHLERYICTVKCVLIFWKQKNKSVVFLDCGTCCTSFGKKKKKKKLSEGQKLSLLVNQIIFKISFSIYFSLVDNKWRREESWDLHLHVITCFAFYTTQRIPIRLFSRQWCWRFLGSRWIRFKLSSSRLFIFFFSVLAAVWSSGDCSIHLHPEGLFRLFQAVCWLCPWLSNFILLYSIACTSFSFCSLYQLLFSSYILFFAISIN